MSGESVIKENKMGTMPINKLLISMSLPMMISMLVQALYNVVDSIFVSQISENALTAVSLAFPVQNFMIAVGVGTGVGINALLSRSLGEKKFEQANKVANNGVFLAVLSYIAFLILGIIFSRRFFQWQTDIKDIVDGGYSYLIIVTTCSFGMYGQIVFEKLMQSTGKTIFSMTTQLTGAIVNIVLDPILIFGLFGFPKLGISGAAIATVIGQICGMSLGIYLNTTKNKEIKVEVKNFRPSLRTIKEIYAVGIPSIIMASIMPVFGINNGMVPIIAYNYGARNKDRLMKTVKISIMYGISIMLIGLVIFQVFPKELLSLFNASDKMISIGVPALRTISISFLFAGYCIVVSSMFQALGNGVMSMIVSLVRQLIVLLPVAYLLSKSGNLNMVWWAYPIAEIASVCLSLIGFKYVYKKEVLPLEKKDKINHNVKMTEFYTES